MINYSMEYSELEIFLIEKLNEFKHGELKPWCEKKRLNIYEVSRFRNKNLPTIRPFFLQDILIALGYKEIKVIPKIYYEFKGE